ncbi:hypothetical protein OOK36_35450 [Streptomyces sp. NBC_00365]|uniref:hypothetical protein n=1 Tax=Streptomyces sp. NBC_00365 TaxID=2975726 RepID=UPI00225A3C69|nr:hypothetical protein [Streptomyces sp. NBC_00365]MCX5094069.1 hypothetical protein [Streptomyces sp. NBC_00365]
MHDDQTSDRGAWVVLGGIHLLNRTAPRRPDEPIVLVRVPPQEVCRPATTVVVRWNTLGLCPADALRPGGGAWFGSARIDGGGWATHGKALREINTAAHKAPSALVPIPANAPVCRTAARK